jgi:hypothetical protein
MGNLSSARSCTCVAVLATVLSAWCASALPGQIMGSVRDSGGIPVSEATVGLWRGSREVARMVTDATGIFRFPGDWSRDVDVLLVRRIGFRPASISISAKRVGIIITLEPVATALPEVVTTAVRRGCPNHDESEARRLWRAMSDRYSTHAHNDDIWTRSIGTWGVVDASQVGEVDESRFREGGSAMVGEWRGALFRSIAQYGYARKLKPGDDPTGEYFAWSYARLDRELDEHFVEADFARRHSLSMWRTDDGSLTITFCGRDHSRPYLEGTLSLSRDTALVAARWIYRTPKPHEGAGGEITFLAPSRRATIWLLVPLRGVFGRRLGGSKSRYTQSV